MTVRTRHMHVGKSRVILLSQKAVHIIGMQGVAKRLHSVFNGL